MQKIAYVYWSDRSQALTQFLQGLGRDDKNASRKTAELKARLEALERLVLAKEVLAQKENLQIEH